MDLAKLLCEANARRDSLSMRSLNGHLREQHISILFGILSNNSDADLIPSLLYSTSSSDTQLNTTSYLLHESNKLSFVHSTALTMAQAYQLKQIRYKV
jgi:hypothetical protein